MDINGKVVLVTGAAVGLGREVAVKFAGLGANVGINYSRSEDDAKETLRQVEAAGAKGLLLKADVSDDAQVRAMVKSLTDAFGRVDYLINNAAITKFVPFKELESLTPEDWARMYAVNVTGFFLVARAVAPIMKSLGEGRIVNMSSTSGIRPGGSSIAYACTKAAINHLTLCLAKTLGPEISVNAIMPGGITGTRWLQNPKVESIDPNSFVTPNPNEVGKGRAASVAEIAEVVVNLATGPGWLSGALIQADGGRSLA